MKRIISLFLCAILLSLNLVVFSACENEKTDVITLYVYNWGEYISDGSDDSYDTNKEFEKWYNDNIGKENGTKVQVNYSTYSSNEDLYAKITSGAVRYDVIVPSDYMVQRLAKEGYLRKLDHSNIPNIENIQDEFMGENAYYDIGNIYSVPYLYGMIGIIYNTTMVDDEDIGSWELLWNEKYKGNILQFNNSRDAFGTALYKLGYDVNNASEAEWNEALEELKKQKKIVQGYVMDEIYNKMENESAAIAAYYAGDYLTMYENNENLEFYYPKEGTNLYVDAMCIPSSSENPEIAEHYINFMLSEEAAIANAEYTYYASPNKKVIESAEYQEYMAEIKEDAYEKMYPERYSEANPNGIKYSAYENLTEEKQVLLNSLWEELKSDMEIGVGIYITCGTIIVSLLTIFIIFTIKKRSRRKMYDA